MIAASCFSGIGGAELALPEAEWLWCAEIEDFPSAVLAKRFGHPNLGDITAPDFIERARALGPLDLLCGGPPCQAFSVAGLRKGIADPRGQLSLRFIEIAHELASTNGLRNLLVENVPGWLSHEDNAFGCFLGGLVGADDALPNPIGGSWPRAGMVAGPRARAAWRVLDAQYAGLAQRRQRVFLVADFGNGADPVSVLFERKSLSGHHPPRRETGQDVAGTLSARTEGGGGLGTDFDIAGGLQPVAAEIAPTLNAAFGDKLGLENQHIDGGDCSLPSVAMCLNAGAMGRQDAESETLIPVNRCDFDVAHTLRGEGFEASEDGSGRGMPLVPICYDTTHITSPGNWSNPKPGDPCHPITATAHVPLVSIPIAFSCKDHGADGTGDLSPTLPAMGHAGSHANAGGQMAVAFEKGINDGQTDEADTFALLRELRDQVGEEAFTQWGLGISHTFQSPEILRPQVHGGSVRCEAEQEHEVVNDSLSRPEDCAERSVRSLWNAGCEGCPPQGWKPSKQLAGELGAHLSILSHQGASGRTFLHDMWRSSCGIRSLQQALSPFEEMGRPTRSENQPKHADWAVRRLTPTEAERLQGYPDGHTLIEVNKRRTVEEDEARYLLAKGAHVALDNQGRWRTNAAADGPRYKALGNAWAVACVRPIALGIMRGLAA